MKINKWINYLERVYVNVINSIAFYPTLLSIGFLLLSFFTIRVEYSEIIMGAKEEIGPALVHNNDNARLVLGTIVGSIISLMVFSFSMVMVVLNRATATLSPRILPGLISSRFHQIVLGFYIGTIVYSLIMIVNINAREMQDSVPSFGIFLSMLFAISCLGLFVYFIHSISMKIQVDNILKDIHKKTIKTIKAANVEQEAINEPATDDWHAYSAGFSGYLKKIDHERLMKFCDKNEVDVQLKLNVGAFVIRHYPFVTCSDALDEEKEEELISCFIMYNDEHISDHYQYGFNQISEIAIKALSPGINDPGTAIRAIDLMADLFIRLMAIRELRLLETDKNKRKIYLKPLTFKKVLFKNLVPIRKYGNQDIMVLIRLLTSLHQMLYAYPKEKLFFTELHELIENIVECSKEFYQNDLDKNAINNIIKQINERFEEGKAIDLL